MEGVVNLLAEFWPTATDKIFKARPITTTTWSRRLTLPLKPDRLRSLRTKNINGSKTTDQT